jgi:MFS family permease
VDPLLDLRFFRSAPFAGATVVAIGAYAAFAGFLFLNTLYLQEVRGLSAFQTGVYTLPLAAMVLVFSPLSGRIVGTHGPRVPLLVAGAATCIGGLMCVPLEAHTPTAWVIATYVMFGLGIALVNPPITNTAVSGMPDSQAGVAAAVASTSRQVGAALGVAVLGSVLNAGLHGSMKTGFAIASHPAWWIVAGSGFAILGVGALTSGSWAVGTAARTAHLFAQDEPDLATATSAAP